MEPRSRLLTGAGAFLVGGLLIWVLAWAIDFSTHVQRIAANPGSHSHGGGELWIRINLPVTGLPFIVAGMASMVGFDRLVNERGMFGRVCAGVLLAVDGLAHAFAFNDHLNEPFSASLFAVAAPALVLVGCAMPLLPRRFDAAWVLLALGLVCAYVVSRTASVPALDMPEAVDGLGLFSKALEIVFIGVVLPGILGGKAPRPAAADAHADDSTAAGT